MFLVYFSHEARATEYLFKLPRVRVAFLTAAYCAYRQNSLHTILSTRGSLNKYSLHGEASVFECHAMSGQELNTVLYSDPRKTSYFFSSQPSYISALCHMVTK